MEVLYSPPVAFALYAILAGLLTAFGRVLAGPGQPNELKRNTYASGEAPAPGQAVPGYQPFFVVALFFAIVHLGALVIGTHSGNGEISVAALVYVGGLMVVLAALILG